MQMEVSLFQNSQVLIYFYAYKSTLFPLSPFFLQWRVANVLDINTYIVCRPRIIPVTIRLTPKTSGLLTQANLSRWWTACLLPLVFFAWLLVFCLFQEALVWYWCMGSGLNKITLNKPGCCSIFTILSYSASQQQKRLYKRISPNKCFIQRFQNFFYTCA